MENLGGIVILMITMCTTGTIADEFSDALNIDPAIVEQCKELCERCFKHPVLLEHCEENCWENPENYTCKGRKDFSFEVDQQSNILEEIDKYNQHWEKVLSNRNVSAIMSTYTDDCFYVFIGLSAGFGKEAVERKYDTFFSAISDEYVRFEFDITAVGVVGDKVYAYGMFNGYKSDDENAKPGFSDSYQSIYKLVNGRIYNYADIIAVGPNE